MTMSKAYSDALEQLRHKGTGKLMDSRKVGNNSYLRLEIDGDGEPGPLRFELHGTPVVSIWPNGDVELQTGGWRTRTTKERMNLWAPGVRVFSTRGVWQVSKVGDIANRELHRPYFDGFRYNADTGEYESDPEASERAVELERQRKQVRKDVRAWLKRLENDPEARAALAAALKAQDFLGDCLYCRAVADEDGGVQALGDSIGAPGHLELHLEEDYYVPSLFVMAAVAKWGRQRGANAAVLAFPVDLESTHGVSEHMAKAVVEYMVARIVPDVKQRDAFEREMAEARGWV